MQVLIQSLIIALFVGLLGLWTNYRLERLKGDLQSKMDALARERELYEKVGPALRAFTPEGTAGRKTAFVEAYALAYIWAPEEVLRPLDDFLALATGESGQVQGTQEKRNRAYDRCMVSLRQAAGHLDTKIKYRRVSF